VEISIRSSVPAGCGTGTSASVSIALLAALAAARSVRWSPSELASAAHRLEVDALGIESGIQDQLCAAFGGINDIEVDHYPEASVRALPAWPGLETLLTLVYLGRAHNSSDLHGRVIAALDRSGSGVLSRLRDAAASARDAVQAQDLHAFGWAMVANNEAQRDLHPELVGVDADRVFEMASSYGSLGWKVNGAGGDGGSVTILSATASDKQLIDRQVGRVDPRYRVFPVRLSAHGCQVAGTL